ncbi:MAG: glycosyltransferase, partial [Clostridiales bacterium]|nr:glycosyltransferase [Clostridiales bacterium]
MVVLIPAFEPDEKLIKLIKDLRQHCTFQMIVVDDGSGSNYRTIFDQAQSLGCNILRYENNRGKGYALKAGCLLY